MERIEEHDEIFTLMMEALDGELQADSQEDLVTHLESCPTCDREWQVLQTVHELFVRTPFLLPAADFTERTLALLPNTRSRLWAMGVIYGVLLFSGLVPLVLVGWLLLQVGPALNQPVIVRSLLQVGGELLGTVMVVLGAFWQGLASLGDLAGQQPWVIGMLLVMVGFVVLWGGIYGQLTSPQRHSV